MPRSSRPAASVGARRSEHGKSGHQRGPGVARLGSLIRGGSTPREGATTAPPIPWPCALRSDDTDDCELRMIISATEEPSRFGLGGLEHEAGCGPEPSSRNDASVGRSSPGRARQSLSRLSSKKKNENSLMYFALIFSLRGLEVDLVRLLGRVGLVRGLLLAAVLLLKHELSLGNADFVSLHVLIIPVHRSRDNDPSAFELGRLLCFLLPHGDWGWGCRLARSVHSRMQVPPLRYHPAIRNHFMINLLYNCKN